MSTKHSFETLFGADGIRVFLYTADHAPLMVEKATGSVTLKFKDGSTKKIALAARAPAEGEPAVYFCPMHADVVQTTPGVCPKCGGMKLYTQDYLYGKADLSAVKPGTLEAVVTIQGLAKPETEASFTETNAAPPSEKPGTGSAH